MTTPTEEAPKEKPRTTMGGFRRQTPAMRVDALAAPPEAIQEMQRGYETRIARQSEAITRLVGLLQDRTEDVAEHMRRANEAAAIVVEDTPPLYATVTAEGGDAEPFVIDLNQLMRLIPEDWDGYNEDDTPITALSAYVAYLQNEVAGQKAKQAYLVTAYQAPVDELTQWMGVHARKELFAGVHPIKAMIGFLETLQDELQEANEKLRQARVDALNNARVANNNAKMIAQPVKPTGMVVEGDDTPPFDPGASVGYVASSLIERSTPMVAPVDPALSSDTETITDWDGAAQLPAGEVRPGGF